MKEQQIYECKPQTKICRAAEHFLLHGGKESAGQQTKMSSATDFIEPEAKIKYEDVLLPESMWISMKAEIFLS